MYMTSPTWTVSYVRTERTLNSYSFTRTTYFDDRLYSQMSVTVICIDSLQNILSPLVVRVSSFETYLQAVAL